MERLDGTFWFNDQMTRVSLALLLLVIAYQRADPLSKPEVKPIALCELSLSDLQLVPGIGPVMSAKIKASQPKDLTSLHGVGEQLAKKWSPYFSLHQP
jgi:hypothetical protein